MAKRTSIYLDAFGHANPIPVACRVGNILTSGIVYGLDPATGKVAPTLEEQCAFMFKHMRAIVEAGGGTVDDIVKVTVWMVDRSQRAPLNAEWLAMFPHAEDRPARQAIQAEALGAGMLIQLDFLAVIGA
ncbi:MULTISPECIES: RidA family protein [unclassified Xanthobacter]|uniref:RidA family protein n=1 Tax=unclassified Xanthobacter TaxID=2623496 RepID=UPI001EE046FD|nr:MULTISPECIES: RidA family protein [unclassified Xanthobacter]